MPWKFIQEGGSSSDAVFASGAGKAQMAFLRLDPREVKTKVHGHVLGCSMRMIGSLVVTISAFAI